MALILGLKDVVKIVDMLSLSCKLWACKVHVGHVTVTKSIYGGDDKQAKYVSKENTNVVHTQHILFKSQWSSLLS